MRISFSPKPELNQDLFVIPFWEGPEKSAEYGKIHLANCLKDFAGKNGETALFYTKESRILLLGLGKKEQATVEALRKAYASLAKFCSQKKLKEIEILFPKCKQKDEFLRGILEGLLLSNYAFTYKHDTLRDTPIALLEKIVLVGVEKTDAVEKIETIVKGVHFVRDLVNANADTKIEQFVKEAKNLHPKVKTTIFDRKKLIDEEMGLILAVNRSSSKDPFLVQASYKGDPKSKEHIVLVGKGVTYDTGGLSLKPTDGMVSMKCDMAGAATVLGTVKTAAELGLKVNVTAVTPLTENCIGSKSYKLGDVYTSYSGKTIEINNTDAEGRLVLADAISYAVDRLDPSCIIDVATLTGACIIALGDEIAGLISNDDILAEALLESSDSADELICRLPMHEDYKEDFKSEIADMLNSGKREAGAIKAALFLQAFVKDVPWAHIDIAGPAYIPKPKHYNPMKATGFGVRFLIDFLEANSSL